MNDERAELVAGLKALSVLHRIKPNECAMLRKAADYIESQPAGTPFAWTTLCAVTAEAVGTLTVRRYRGSDAMVNHDFDLHATLPDGSYQLYLRSETRGTT